jgi:diguanylate cyclase (GGDEF)-like protein/PAS domain S-box-containing protein
MLAYEPGVAVAYDIGLTGLSLLAAATVTFVGLAFAVSAATRWAAPIGGAIVGGGVACMHYTGMWALELPGRVTWAPDLVIASIALGMAFGSFAMAIAVRRTDIVGTFLAAILLTLAIVSHHFTAMGAVQIVPDATRVITPLSLSEPMLALAIAGAAIAVLGMSLIGAVADSRLATRTRQFARAHQELIADTEDQLREQNARLDAALNNMSQGVCMFDASARVAVYNRRFLEMYSLSPQVVRTGCTLLELIKHRKDVGLLDADPETYCRDILDNVARGKGTSFISRTTDGRLIESINQPMPGGGWMSTHEDITARRIAEAQLREQKVQLDIALHNMNQGLLLFDAEGRVVLCNQRYLEMYKLPGEIVKSGCPMVSVRNLRVAKGTFARDAEQYIRDLHAALAQGKPITLTTELSDGRHISIRNNPMADGRWVSTHEDITEQRQAEEQLREQKLRMDTALDNMNRGLLMFDAEDRVVLYNRLYLQMYGLSPDVLQVGCPLETLLQLRRETGTFLQDPAEYIRGLRAKLREGKTATATFDLADGRIIQVINQPMSDGRWVSTHEDITDERRAEERLREQKLQLDTALNTMSQGLNMFDGDGRLVVCNDRYLKMYNLSPDTVKPGCTVRDLVQARIASGTFFAADPEKYASDLLAAMNRREPTSATMELTNGRIIAVTSQPTPDNSSWVVTHEDVTERRRAEQERDRSQAFTATIIENVPATIMVKEVHSGRYLLVNRAGEEYLGVSRDKVVGKTAVEIFSPTAAQRIEANDRDILLSGQPQFFDEHPVTTPGGVSRIVATTRVPIAGPDGGTQYLLTVVDDRTHRKRAEAQIAHMAHHDSLTNLPNRAAFNQCLDSTLEAAIKDGSSFALMCLDIDRFKEINDVFGHAAGDKLLCEVSRRLQAAAGGAFVARLSGDEFTVIATDGTQPATAEALADKLIEVCAEEFSIDGQQLRTGLSIGVAVFPADGADAATLVANANAALYRSKAEGRGTYRFFEAGMDKRLRERRALQHDLQSAIERSELTLNYQPQARIGGDVTGFEALVRWRHPARGVIPPGTFIPLAEESGLIISMGEWILREACRQAAAWPKPLQIAINLSPIQFRHGDLPGMVHSVLIESGLSPSRLELEITEGVLIGDFSRAVSILRRLKALGVKIAMDDFGTGYSSLSYLQSFPFDKIKIDQAFISNLERNPQSATIIRAVIGLARGLKLPVVAEGVETKEQLAFLAKEACDEIQGYLIGRPRPIEEYAEMTGQAVSQQPKRVGAAAG